VANTFYQQGEWHKNCAMFNPSEAYSVPG